MRRFSNVILLILLSCIIAGAEEITRSSMVKPYCGCLVFVDDIDSIDKLNYGLSFDPDFLIRSWYRWGESSEKKAYQKRSILVKAAATKKVGIGGGASLSVVNEHDLKSAKFDKSWLSIELNGTVVEKNGRKFASISSPEFRNYLIEKIFEQVELGVLEIHLGESNGEIHFDDWTLGIKGEFGFVQWLAKKYSDRPLKWWLASYGALGRAIYEDKTVDRSHFINLNVIQKKQFEHDFGKVGSWEGKNSSGEFAFLRDLYKHNLQSFVSKLRARLDHSGHQNVVIDVWGFASWMAQTSVQPSAYISSPPDERWRLDWSTDPNFDLSNNRKRIKKIMLDQVNSVKPTPVIYMIDHSKPFDDFKRLTDARQAEITHFFSDITKEVGANFIFRTYSNDRKYLGKKTELLIKKQCLKRKVNFCPRTN